jgi:predicted aspartyl protease
MVDQGENGVGRFSVDAVITNYRDLVEAQDGFLPPDKVRRESIKGIVDSGAVRLVLPQALVQRLGIAVTSQADVRYADGRTEKRDVVEGVNVEILGRSSTFRAVVEPGRTTALIGAIVLEDLDFLVDCTHQRLVPRDPNIIVSEIE